MGCSHKVGFLQDLQGHYVPLWTHLPSHKYHMVSPRMVSSFHALTCKMQKPWVKETAAALLHLGTVSRGSCVPREEQEKAATSALGGQDASRSPAHASGWEEEEML